MAALHNVTIFYIIIIHVIIITIIAQHAAYLKYVCGIYLRRMIFFPDAMLQWSFIGLQAAVSECVGKMFSKFMTYCNFFNPISYNDTIYITIYSHANTVDTTVVVQNNNYLPKAFTMIFDDLCIDNI